MTITNESSKIFSTKLLIKFLIELSTKAAQLPEIGESVNNEIQQLAQLHNLEISADILDTLIQTYDDNAKTYQEEYNERYEVLSQEILDLRNAWTKEQKEHQRTIKERNDNLNGNRQRDAAEYKYDLELQRKLASDEYEQQQKILYQELKELEAETEKQWNETHIPHPPVSPSVISDF